MKLLHFLPESVLAKADPSVLDQCSRRKGVGEYGKRTPLSLLLRRLVECIKVDVICSWKGRGGKIQQPEQCRLEAGLTASITESNEKRCDEHLLSSYQVPGIMLGTGHSDANKLYRYGVHILEEEEIDVSTDNLKTRLNVTGSIETQAACYRRQRR